MKYYLLRTIFFVLFLLGGRVNYAQSYLADYTAFNKMRIKRDNTLDSIRKNDRNGVVKLTRQNIRDAKKEALVVLEQTTQFFSEVFAKYRAETNFDFNKADSVLLVFRTGVEMGLSEYIFISGKDTVSFAEKTKRLSPHHYGKEIIYRSFLIFNSKDGIIKIEDREQLLSLAARHKYTSLRQIAEQYPALDGETSNIYFARKINGKYTFEYCFLQAFGFPNNQ